MRKLFMAAILSGLLVAMPLIALPPAPAISVLQLFGTAGVTANTNSAIIDVSRMVNGAVQICSTDAPGATIATVKIRMSSNFHWYIAAQLTAISLCGSTTAAGYITLPLASQLQVEVSGYATGHIIAAYGERAF